MSGRTRAFTPPTPARRRTPFAAPARRTLAALGLAAALLAWALPAASAVAAPPPAAGADADPVGGVAVPADAGALVAAGDALYAAGDFEGAAAAYADAAAVGGLDGAHAVRWGNANVRLGAPGRAMAAYRIAGALAPRDAALRANVAWLRAQLRAGASSAAAGGAVGLPAGSSPTDPGSSTAAGAAPGTDAAAGAPGGATAATDIPPPAADAVFAPARARWWSPAWWAETSRGWVTLDELGLWSLGLWWPAVLGLWLGRRGGRRAWRVLGAACLAATLVTGGLLAIRLARRAEATPAIVVGPGPTAVRQGPGTPFAALRALPEGADVRYVERRGRWLRLAESGGVDEPGWVLASTVVDVPE